MPERKPPKKIRPLLPPTPITAFIPVVLKPVKPRPAPKPEEKPKPPPQPPKPAPPEKPAAPPAKPPEKRLEVKGAGTYVVGEGTEEYVTPEGIVQPLGTTEYVTVNVEPSETTILVTIEHFTVDDLGRKKTLAKKEVVLERAT